MANAAGSASRSALHFLTASEWTSSRVRACLETHLPYALLFLLLVPNACLNVVTPISARRALQNFAAFLKSVCDTAAGETVGTGGATRAAQTIHARFIPFLLDGNPFL